MNGFRPVNGQILYFINNEATNILKDTDAIEYYVNVK